MPVALNMQGKTFGRLFVLSLHSKGVKAGRKWLCKCRCGNEVVITTGHLSSGHTKSCGCLGSEIIIKRNYKHGQGARQGKSREYKAWKEMNKRCAQVNSKNYKWYGAKGITVCPEWQSDFSKFYSDLGPCPEYYELDRLDNTKGYEPSNCRWASEAMQSRNRGYVKLTMEKAVHIRSSGLSTKELMNLYGVSKTTITKVKSGKAWKAD